MKAPIAIFAFNRPLLFSRMIDSLKRNEGLEGRDIFVFIDGPRNDDDRPKIAEVCELARALTDNLELSSSNKGLAMSVISGVSKLMDKYGRTIVIEDDLVLMPGFLQFMDEALDFYADDSRIFSVCGFSLKINKPADYPYDIYLSLRSSSWGWATWKDRWDKVDWAVSDFDELSRSLRQRRDFNRGGSDMYAMLKGYMDGKNNSWAIRFCYSQFRNRAYSIHPFRSLVANEGYGEDATNCRQKYNRFKPALQRNGEGISTPPTLSRDVSRNKQIDRQLRRYHSIPARLYSLIRRKLNV